MLEKISYSDLPTPRRQSKNIAFADKCVDDFVELNCDAVKVSGWPIPRETKSLVSTMRHAIKKKHLTHRVVAHSDQNFVYLARTR